MIRSLYNSQIHLVPLHPFLIVSAVFPVISWFMIRIIHLVLVPVSGISCDDNDKGSFVMLMRWTLQALKSPKDGGWSPEEPTLWPEGWNCLPATLAFGVGERGWSLKQLPMANDLIMPMKWSLHKNTKEQDSIQRASRRWTCGDAGRIVCLERARKEAPHSFIFNFFYFILFIELLPFL